MVTDAQAVIALARQYAADVRRVLPIDKVYLYGSYAKGTQREENDVDVCFFSAAFEARRRWNVLTDLFQIKAKYDKDILIEPNAFPASELSNDNPFVKEVLRTGVEL